MVDNQISSGARIALVAFSSLGDGLIYYMIAENLRRHGYDITLYGDITYDLRKWMPSLAVKPFPPEAEYDKELGQYHAVIISPSDSLRKQLSGAYLEEIKSKWILLCQKAPRNWRHADIDSWAQQFDPDIWQQIHPLIHCGNSIRFKKFPSKNSLVEIAVAFMQERMGLQAATRMVHLQAPAGLTYRKHQQRIVISPDSAWAEKKDWSVSGFIIVARLLLQAGFEPVFSVAPANQDKWSQLLGSEFILLRFNSIDALAAYIYESGAFIGNDSGGGHLASILRIPVVTIYRKRNPDFSWRPGWGTATVVTPSMTLPWFGGAIWRPFIRPGHILRALNKLLSQPRMTIDAGELS